MVVAVKAMHTANKHNILLESSLRGVHDNSSKDTSSNTTISLQRQLVYYDSLSNATLSLLLFLPSTSGRKIS